MKLPLLHFFLSFYGNDTRRNFIANLYFALDQAGIVTFRDDPALEKGEEISSGLSGAIRNANKFVVVISENYAHSWWCLDELVEILGCRKTKNQVIPVFYYVNPTDLRYQKGSFGEAFEAHKKRYSVDMIDKWKSALAEIAGLSGHHLKQDASENESDIIQKIVEDVAPQASARVLHLEKYLVGIDYAIKEIYEQLNPKSNDVRTIGICGMSGIGKTTTAKAFYNKYSNKFDITCYIPIVKQTSQGGAPLLSLLEQLLIELLRRKDYKVFDFESGMKKLKQILCSKKALIILDDLDQSCYLDLVVGLYNLLSGGSRIMITTRDVNLLNQVKVDISQGDIYMVTTLGLNESLRLFSHHAFRKLIPPESFRELSVSFVRYAGGHPLALKVLGSSLRGRTQVSFWKDKLQKLQKIPEKEIQKKLQLSYDELDDGTQKAIFLDIAFFFVGRDKDDAIHILESCGYYPVSGIPILVERCLLTIDECNKFQMHNLILDMGRKLGESRGLFWRGNSWEDLQILKVTNEIEGLIVDLTKSTKKIIPVKISEKLPNLRLLEMVNAHHIDGSFASLFGELRCIRWSYCSWKYWPSSFRPQKLVSLEMPFNKFKELWKYAKTLESLKTINLSYSKNINSTHDFRDLKLVERLLLRGCRNLLKVHSSIGQLGKLVHLDLGKCPLLKELPQSFGQLTNLVYLDLGKCHSLKELPQSFGQLTNLVHLDLGGCHSLEELPQLFGRLTNLVHLDLGGCHSLEELPQSFGQLTNLSHLDMDNCGQLKELPESIGHLTNLGHFDLSDCHTLKRLPTPIKQLINLGFLDMSHCCNLKVLLEQLCDMRGLKILNVSDTAIEQLPVQFGRLTNLVDLRLSHCKNLISLPPGIWDLGLLDILCLKGCSKLERLPEKLRKMQSLDDLDASGTTIEKLPDSFGLLSRLSILNLEYCEKLRYLSSSIGDLMSFAEECRTEGKMVTIEFPRNKFRQHMSLTVMGDIEKWLPMILSLSSIRKLLEKWKV